MTDAGTATGTVSETRMAEALVRALPGPALMAQVHVGAPIAADLAGQGVQATYVGARSADLALVLVDRTELVAAGGDARVRIADVLRPALEQACAQIGGGLLGEVADGAALFGSPDAAVFDLVGAGRTSAAGSGASATSR